MPSSSRTTTAGGPPAPAVLARTRPEGTVTDLTGFTAEELRVLALLAALAPELSPSVPARERMRARVLAGTAAAAAQEQAGTNVEVVALATHRRDRHGVRGRFLVAAAAALCLFFALSGTSLVLSRDALPGDALYSLKRAGEATQLQLTFGDVDRGLRHLDYAARRVDELSALVDRGNAALGGVPSSGISYSAVEQVDPVTVTTLMDGLDDQVVSGAGLLTTAGVAGDPTALSSLSTWSQGQSVRLTSLRSLLPAEAHRVEHSLGVLERVRERAEALGARLSCSPITTGATDELGPRPAAACLGPDTSTGNGVTGPVTTVPAPSAVPPIAPDAQPGTGTAVRGPDSTSSGAPGGAVATTVPAQPATPALPAPGGGPATPVLPRPGVPSMTSIPLPPLPPLPPLLPLPSLPSLLPLPSLPSLLPIPPVTIGPILPGVAPTTLGG